MNKLMNRRNIVLLAAELLLLLLLLPGCLRRETEIAAFSGGQMQETVPGAVCRSVGMELSPGVYEIRVDTYVPEGAEWTLELLCDTAPFRSLVGNRVSFLGQEQGAVLDYYVSAHLKDVYVLCTYAGCDAGAIRQITLCKTNRGGRMLLAVFVLLAVCVDALVLWRDRIRGRKESRAVVVPACLAGIALLAYFPFWTDYLLLGERTLVWLGRTETLLQALPRSLAELFAGRLIFLIPVAVCWLGFSVMTAYKGCALLLLLLAAVTSRRALLTVTNNGREALLGAMLYVLSPCCVGALYVQGNPGALGVAAFWPLVCGAVYGLARRRDAENGELRGKIVFLVVGFAAILECGLRPAELLRCLALLLIWSGVVLLSLWGYRRLCERTGKAYRVTFWAALCFLLPVILYLNRLVFQADVYYIYTAKYLDAAARIWQENREAALAPERVMTYMSLMSMPVAKQIVMLALQLGTLLTAYYWFRRLFDGQKRACAFGVLLYMTLPCRIRIWLELGDVARLAIWMLLPLCMGALSGLLRRKHPLREGAVLCAGIAGIAGLAVRMGMRTEIVPQSIMPQSIMPKGYSLGGFFAGFVYRDDRPGLGIALELCLLVGLWLFFVKGQRGFGRESRMALVIAILCAGLSLRYFPWDVVQRLGNWALLAVSALQTPAVFFGAAQIALCVPGARAMELLDGQEEQITHAMYMLVILAGAGYVAYCLF